MKIFRANLAPKTGNRSQNLNGRTRVDLEFVCDVLESVGTNEAVLGLVAILRGVKPQGINSYGYKDDANKGDDDIVAASITRIPNGLSMAKASCDAGEFERILVLASAYTQGVSPDLIPELEALGTPHAIVWLVEYLRRPWAPARLERVASRS